MLKVHYISISFPTFPVSIWYLTLWRFLLIRGFISKSYPSLSFRSPTQIHDSISSVIWTMFLSIALETTFYCIVQLNYNFGEIKRFSFSALIVQPLGDWVLFSWHTSPYRSNSCLRLVLPEPLVRSTSYSREQLSQIFALLFKTPTQSLLPSASADDLSSYFRENIRAFSNNLASFLLPTFNLISFISYLTSVISRSECELHLFPCKTLSPLPTFYRIFLSYLSPLLCTSSRHFLSGCKHAYKPLSVIRGGTEEVEWEPVTQGCVCDI